MSSPSQKDISARWTLIVVRGRKQPTGRLTPSVNPISPYIGIRYTTRLAEAGVNALAKTINGLD